MDEKTFIGSCRSLRKECLDLFLSSGEAHLGGSFSAIEILTYLFKVEKIDPLSFVLSKSHASHPLLAILRQLGYSPSITTHLEIDRENGITCTTGSLGHGLPIAVGIAYARKRQNDARPVYVLVSDGECQEGTTWESLLLANKFKLDNLNILVDRNSLQALGSTEEVLPLEPLSKKFEAFGCKVFSCDDGHCFAKLNDAFHCMDSSKVSAAKVLILKTIKGKGIRAFENDPVWHAKKIRRKEYDFATKYLE